MQRQPLADEGDRRSLCGKEDEEHDCVRTGEALVAFDASAQGAGETMRAGCSEFVWRVDDGRESSGGLDTDESGRRSGGACRNNARVRVLVVEDEPKLAALIARALREGGDLRLDPAAHRGWRGEHELELSAREFALLELLMRNAGNALTRGQLLDGAWDMAFESRSNIVDVYMRYLRSKIDRPFGRNSI